MAANSAQKLLTTISTMLTLVDNFPQSILALLRKGNVSSVITFIIIILKMCGVDTDELLSKIINKVFSQKSKEKAQEIAEKIQLAVSKIQYATSAEAAFNALSDLDIDSEFVTKLEDGTKVIVGNILAALLSCNCIPIIPDNKMDKGYHKPTFGFISIPTKYIDLFGKLQICPTTSTGLCYYNLDKQEIYKEVGRYAIPDATFKKLELGVKSKAEKTVPTTVTSNSPKYIRVIDADKNIDRFYRKSSQSTLSSGELWKSRDLDAFIWYAINRGANTPQREMNKLMWDNRLRIYNNTNGAASGSTIRTTIAEWNYWIDSKTVEYSDDNANDCILRYSGQPADFKDAELYPIMQLEREELIEDEDRLRVYISSQRYFTSIKENDEKLASISGSAKTYAELKTKTYKKSNSAATDSEIAAYSAKTFKDEYKAMHDAYVKSLEFASTSIFNRTMYKFNSDYLKSIKIFSTEAILAGFLKELYGAGFTVTLNLKQQEWRKRVQNMVANIIEADDMDVENCYYTFSNNDYDEMQQSYELSKYSNVRGTNYDGVTTQEMSEQELLDSIEESTTNASVAGNVTTIKKNVYDLTSNDDGTTSSTEEGEDWIKMIINAIMMPLVEEIMAPKVMLLFLINLNVAGIIKDDILETIASQTNPYDAGKTAYDTLTTVDGDDVLDFITKKIMALISQIIVMIKDMIVELLMELFMEYIEPIIAQFVSYVLLEKINMWLEFLLEMIECIPILSFNFKKYQTAIDDVNYADIEKDQTTPESDDATSC